MFSRLMRLLAAQVLIHTCMTGVRLATPLVLLQAGHAKAALGVLLGQFALSQFLLSIPSGRYSDARGILHPVVASMALASGGALLAAFLPTYPALFVAAFATGAATTMSMVPLQQRAGRLAQEASQLRYIYGWMSTGPALANAIGPLLAGALIDFAGFGPAFAALAILPLLAWLAVRPLALEPHTPTAHVAGAARQRALDLLLDPSVRKLFLVNWMIVVCWEVHAFVLPILGHERGISASAIGAILSCFALAAAVSRVALPALSRRLPEHVIVTALLVAAGCVCASYPLLRPLWAMALASALLGLALGCGMPIIMALLMERTPVHRHGEALGLRLAVLNGSNALMPAVLGTLATGVGVAALFWVAAGGAGLAMRIAWRLGKDAD